jgi:3-methylfumaryl-CoA hydratase
MRTTAIPLGSHLETWAPGPVSDEDALAPGPVAALSALLDLPGAAAGAGDPLPPLWHWLYFLRWPPQAELGADGHPRHGHFLPPIPDRRRMVAGGRCEIARPLRLGEPTERISSLGTVTAKHGGSGELLFATQHHELRQRGRTCLVEEQDVVYRSGPGPRPVPTDTVTDDGRADLPPAEPQPDSPWHFRLHPDPTLLFRFSALTANAHRIHYDAPYARDEEGYPGPVVHGPLLALALLELVRRNAPSRQVRSLSYRLRRPVFAGEHLLVCGTPAEGRADLRIASGRGTRHATAEVAFA